MDSLATIRYRIRSHGGILFVRELICGEVVARIPGVKSTLCLTEMDEVVRMCADVFLGSIVSVTHDDDSVCVTCKLAKVG